MSNLLSRNNGILFFLLFIYLFSNAINIEPYENKKNKTNLITTPSFQQTNLQEYNNIKKIYNNDFLNFALVSETNTSTSYKSSRVAIKINALIVTGTFSPALEYKFSHHFSGQVQLIGVHQPKGFMGTNKPLSLFSILLEPRYYPMETFNGIFLGVNVGFSAFNMARAIIANNWQESFNNVDHKGWNVMGGLSLGWTLPIGSNLAIEPFITTGFTYSTWHNYVNNELVTETPKTRLDFVYAYNGGLNIIYKIGSSSYTKSSMGPSKQYNYKGAKHNRNIYRKLNKHYRR